MTTTSRNAEIIENAVRISETTPCYWRNNGITKGHENCEITTYTTAMILTYGSDKAHRITFTHHTGDDKMYAPAGPGCGSKRAGLNWVSVGKFRPAVTCGRC